MPPDRQGGHTSTSTAALSYGRCRETEVLEQGYGGRREEGEGEEGGGGAPPPYGRYRKGLDNGMIRSEVSRPPLPAFTLLRISREGRGREGDHSEPWPRGSRGGLRGLQ